MKSNKIIFFIITIFLSSCSANDHKSTESFYGANGKQTKVVTCSMYSIKNCNKKAGSICKSKGYRVINKEKPALSVTVNMYYQCK